MTLTLPVEKRRTGNFVQTYGGLSRVMSLAGAACVAVSLWLLRPLPVLLASYILLLLGFGLGMPVLSSLALDAEHDDAGSASAWVGSVSFLAGAIVSPVVMLGRPTVSTGLVILLFTALSCLLTQRLYRKYFDSSFARGT